MGKISKNQLNKNLIEASQYYNNGNFDAAELIINKNLNDFPNHPDSLTNLGTIYIQKGLIQEGVEILNKSLKYNPYQPVVLNNLASLYYELKDYKLSKDFIDRAIRLNPKYADAYNNLGLIYKSSKEFHKSLDAFNKAIDLQPNNILFLENRGILNLEIENFNNAIEDFTSVIKLNKNNPRVLTYLSNALIGNNCIEEAYDIISNALILNPNDVYANNTRVNILIKLRRYDEAREQCQTSINIDPKNDVAFLNLGIVEHKLRKYENAELCYKKAIDINPNFHDAKYSLALLYLNNKNYKEGWDLYEERWLSSEFSSTKLLSNKPFYHNSVNREKLIYVWREQGIGDQILFGSMLNFFEYSNLNCIVDIDARLVHLFQRSFKKIKFIGGTKPLDSNQYDYHIPIGSLGIHARKSVVEFTSFGNSIFLKSDPLKTEAFKNLLKKSGKIICGISWKSSNRKHGRQKSLTLLDLLPILQLDNITFVDLQYGNNEEEKSNIYQKFGIKIESIKNVDNFNDIDSLASVIDACDIVLTTSNVTAHLSGGLGKKTYLLLTDMENLIWYWHENDKISTWYPSVTIFRKTEFDDPRKYINEIANLLK